MSEIFLASSLLFTTAALLAFAVALYDLFLQISIKFGLFRDPRSSERNPLDVSQIFGQIIFTLIILLLAYAVILYFRPYASFQNKIPGIGRAIADNAAIKNIAIEDIAVRAGFIPN